MENNQEKKEYTLIEKEDEIQLNEEDLKKIAGAYYDDDEGPECPYCGSHHTEYVNVAALIGRPRSDNFFQCNDCRRQFR
jgi:DNA-directed RNA polymerase subunit M/transcription elongation factor TFIIS